MPHIPNMHNTRHGSISWRSASQLVLDYEYVRCLPAVLDIYAIKDKMEGHTKKIPIRI